jgi:putative endonuclease
MLPRTMLSWLRSFLRTDASMDVLGQRGENLAAKFLRNRGFKILLRNFRCAVGEIDIIARDGKTIVFVEVKTRADDDTTPEEQVNDTKRHQITKAARFYLGRYGFPQPAARFDVVAIVWPNGQEPQIRHTADAFEATF